MAGYVNQWKILLGKKMPKTARGMTGCVHGMYCRNSESYYYRIKGIFGVHHYKAWGYDRI